MEAGINSIAFGAQQATQVAKKENKNSAFPTLVMDLGLGALAGGIVGNTSRPWQLNGQITDEFVSTFAENVKDLESVKKKPDTVKYFDEIKGLFNLNLRKGMSEEALIELLEKQPGLLNLENIEKSDLKNKIKEEIQKAGGAEKFVDEKLQRKSDLKGIMTDFFADVKKGKLKSLDKEAELVQKESYGVLEKQLKNMRRASIAKWAAIGAVAMAVSGALTDSLMRKNKAKKQSQIKTYRS